MTTPTPAENEALETHPKVMFEGVEYQLIVSQVTNKMLRDMDEAHMTFVLDKLIGREAADKFIDTYDEPGVLGDFLKTVLGVIGTKNS
jgi:hypothetical protein